MEQVINNLLGRYERGALSRRDLVGALAVVALTNQSASAAGFESSTLNHVSITVSNLQRSVDFYRNVFGLPVQSENKAAELVQLKLGPSQLSIRRADGPKGGDHCAIGLDRFNNDQKRGRQHRRRDQRQMHAPQYIPWPAREKLRRAADRRRDAFEPRA